MNIFHAQQVHATCFIHQYNKKRNPHSKEKKRKARARAQKEFVINIIYSSISI